MIDWYPWVVLAHVIGAFGFVLAHGVSAFVAFRMRADRRPEQVAAMLSLSSTSFALMYASLLLLLAAGAASGFMGNWWGEVWIWVSIGLFMAIATAMYVVGTRFYVDVRHAVGLVVPQDGREALAPTAISAAELAALLESRQPYLLALIGGVGLALLVWLMEVKPG